MEYHQTVTPVVMASGIYPREGGLEDQDPAYLMDLQVIYKLRNRILTDLKEEGAIAGLDEMQKRMNK